MPCTNNEWQPNDYLDSLIMHGVKLGLQNISALMDACEDPHLSYPTVHVAGTNGKGSSLAFLAAILETAGYRAGRFTSPHLLHITERFLTGNCPMTLQDLHESVAFFQNIAARLGITPTYFEMNTAMAFRWFARQAVDIALVEVGMGGRFDSTNIVKPEVCAITNIDMDHTQYLGNTRAAIAFEKAGILKPGVPAVVGETGEEALPVIREQAALRKAPLHCFNGDYSFEAGGTTWHPIMAYRGLGVEWADLALGLAGAHQAHNAALAVTMALLLRDTFPHITEPAIREGLSSARWPGRLERVLDSPPVFMDAAHNPAGCQVLAHALERCVVVFSVSSDKDAASMIDILSPIAAPLILTAYQGGRSMSIDSLRQQAGRNKALCFTRMEEALDTAMKLASEERPLLITGSIYGAGEARQILMERHGASTPSFDAVPA